MAICWTFAVPAKAADDSPTPSFRLEVAEASADDRAIAEFYRRHDYPALWTGADDAPRRTALFQALLNAGDHGLPEGRYQAHELMARFAAVQSEGQRARLDVAVTRAFVQYAHDVRTGFLTPSDIDATMVREVSVRDTSAMLEGFFNADPQDYLANLPPQMPEYAQLQKTRLDLLDTIASGGWGPAIKASKLEPGDSGGEVIALRDRLVALGYMQRSVTAEYDGAISRAVQIFQIDQGLTADGVAGESTISELNRSAAERLASVTVGLERLRWMNGLPLGQRHVWVNLPDFTAKLVENGRTVFESVTVVGQNRPDTRSPEFSDQIEFMVVNPTWNVPRSITVKEYLPMLQKNPQSVGHLRIVDRRGRAVDRSAVDFTQFTAQNFPFSMSQAPSSRNALGLVKFMFPNKWNIYLHDTPQKPLFKKESRAFSHGCIRMGDPFGFAYALLSVQSNDPEGLFKSHLATGVESTISLDKPVPVHLVYFTAWPDARGHVGYRRDVYGRDQAIFDAMRAAGVVLPEVQG
ncbi:MAG: L,D-transpeptidase family protein [Paracoccaceae bacterium]